MLVAPGSNNHFDDSAERSMITYHRAPRGSRGDGGVADASHVSEVLAGVICGPPASEAWVKPSRASVARTMANNIPSSAADADGPGKDILAGDLYMRMVDELVARGCGDPTRSGNGGGDDDVYFFQHCSPRATADAPGGARGHASRDAPCPGLSAACQLAAAGVQPPTSQRSKEQPRRFAAPSQKAAEVEQQRDLEMDRLDSALARHQGQSLPGPEQQQQQQQRGARSAAIDIADVRPGKQAGGAAAPRETSLYTAAGSAPASPFGSIPQEIVTRARSYQQLSHRLDSADSAQEWSGGGHSSSGPRNLAALERSLSGEPGFGAYGGSASPGGASASSSRAQSVSGRSWPLEGVLEHYPEASTSSAGASGAVRILNTRGRMAQQQQLQLDSLTLSDTVLTTVCMSVQSTMKTELVGVTLFRGSFLHSALLLSAGDHDTSYIPTTSSFGDWLYDPALPDVFVVEDTLQDPRFRAHKAVTALPHIRFYAAAPIVSSCGQRLGALCVADTVPQALDEELLLTLSNFSKAIVKRLENMSLGTRRTIVQSTLLRTLSQRDEALALVDITTANWQILYAKDSWEQQEGDTAQDDAPVGLWDIFKDASEDGWEWAQPTERYEEFVSTSRCFDAVVRPRQPGGPDTLVTVSFRPVLEAGGGGSGDAELPGFAAEAKGPVRVMQPYYIAVIEAVRPGGAPVRPVHKAMASQASLERERREARAEQAACMGCTCTIS